MMQLTDLPEEIIVMIVRRLDFWSLHSLYNSCKNLRNLVCLRGVVIECNLSLNVMSTVNSLKLDFFKEISNHLLELNMQGFPDLYKTKAMPAFKRLKRLKKLDISYTNLNILDLIEIYNACPTLKDVTVNFEFGQAGAITEENFELTDKIFQECQTLFGNFDNVDFVGSLSNLLSSNLILNMLKKSKLESLKLSVVEQDNINTVIRKQYPDCPLPEFNHFAVYLINWKLTNMYECLSKFPVLSAIDFKNYEFFLVYKLNVHIGTVFATPIFKKFFSDNFDITIECVTDYYNIKPVGNVAIMIWNKETTQFDNDFFHKLYRHVKQYFPFHYRALSNESCPEKYDWAYTVPQLPDEAVKNDSDCQFKAKRRFTVPKIVLNYDNLFKEKLKARFSILFNAQGSVSAALTTNCGYLKKLSFLSLTGTAVYYSSDFFNVLFRCCNNLVTLNVESPQLSSCAAAISRGIPLSLSMKNLRLIDKGIEFKNLFDSFSQCQTLENIHLLDHRQWHHSKIADPSLLIENCRNLYSVFIDAPFSGTAQVKQLQLFNKAKARYGKPFLKVVINQDSYNYDYEPFVDVFQLNPIKPI